MKHHFRLFLIALLMLAIGVAEPSSAQATGFTLQYPTDARPAKITRKFVSPANGKTAHEGVDLYAPEGSPVWAGAAGTVKKVVPAEDGKGWGAYVTVKTVHKDIKYKVTYGNLKSIQVTVGQQVNQGALLARSAGGFIKLVIQASEGGMSGFKVRNVVSPKTILQLADLRLRPTDNGLRVRSAPIPDAPILTQINQWDFVETSEIPYNAMLRAGKDGKWLPVKTASGVSGYAFALYLKAVSLGDPKEGIPGTPIKGMNLDRYHPLGTPPADPLVNLGWVRINYDLSYNPDNGSHGNTDIWATYNRYHPIIKRYADSGNKVILVFTHQLYGEGQGYVWEQMSPAQWQELATRYAAFAGQVAGQYAAEKLVYAYQIWNEQDTLPGNGGAAVPMPYNEYANLFTQSARAIRQVDARAKVITGGHVSGDVLGGNYARGVLSLLPLDVRPDGIAFHPYGLGPEGSPFNLFGTIDDAIKSWSGVMPNTPLWITEWGILDHQNNDSIAPAVAAHAAGFMEVIEQQFPGMVAAAAWYAWADSMDNGYGMVNASGQPKEPLYSTYLGIAARFSPLADYGNTVLPLPRADN
jgi:hypothetical protein